MAYLSADELLAGSDLTHDLPIPAGVLHPEQGVTAEGAETGARVRLRPLSMRAVQRILKAAKDDDGLSSALMVREALVDPVLSYEQVLKLHSGLVQFILAEVQRISGLKTSEDQLTEYVQAPLAKACFILGREFGWSPQEVAELTVGQILMYLEMIRRNDPDVQPAC